MQYQIKYGRPTEYNIVNRAIEQFGINLDNTNVVFTVGNIIYSPGS